MRLSVRPSLLELVPATTLVIMMLKIGKKKSSTRDYDNHNFCSVVTKVGSRLWSISFAATPDSRGNHVGDMKASYPRRLLVCFDNSQKLIMYDCFAFVPTTFQAFKGDVKASKDICTESGLRHIEALLCNMRKKPRRQVPHQFMLGRAKPNTVNETLPLITHSQNDGNTLPDISCTI